MGFLKQVKNSKAKRLRDRLLRKAVASKVLQVEVAQPLQTYLDSRHATVEEWVDLPPIFDVCTRETGY